MRLNLVVSLAAAMLAASPAVGQSYPAKPILVLGGGGSDVIFRVIQTAVSNALGQPLVAENRNVVLGGLAIVKGPADGYTVGVYGQEIWLGPLMRSAGYDALRDLAGVTQLTRQPGVLLVHASLPVKSIKELIALAKARPGQLNYGSANTGALGHLSYELFKSMAGVDILRIAYKGTAASTTALMANEVQTMVGIPATVSPAIKSGKARALAVTTAQRSTLLPDLPTVAESGLPGYEVSSALGMLVNAKTPAAIVKLLNEKVVAVLNNPEIKAQLLAAGTEAVGSTPQEFDAFMKAEIGRMGKVIKDNNITAE